MRKGKMYKSAEEGDSEPLPKVKAGEIPLTKRERAHNNPFLPDLE